MRVIQSKVFPGPSGWSWNPVLEIHLEVDSTDDRTPFEFAQTVLRLHLMSGVSARELMPERLAQQPISPNLVGVPATTVKAAHSGTHLVAFEFEEEALIRECVQTALRLCAETKPGTIIDLRPERRRLADLADDLRLGPSSRAILRAATAHGIPHFRLNQGSLVQLGEGAYQRRIWTAETDNTSAIAEAIASDKQLTRALLAAVGVCVPQGRTVSSREDAWQAAEEFGLPVAVKPRKANHAVGVTLDLADKEGVLAAYDWACQASQTNEIMVEQFIHGVHHRLLVVGEDLVAASVARREYVYGDGVSTVRQLVEAVNRDPRRGENYTDRLEVVILNKSAALVLRKQGLDFDAVPEKDQQVLIDHVGDLVEDCTDAVHPQTRAQAVLAAKTVGLNIAGMDVVATDIGQPLVEQRGCFIEVNAGPSLTSHISPLIGKPRPVGEAILQQIFPTNSQSKVPLILVAHDERSPHDQTVPLSEILAQKLGEVGFHVGIATIDPRPSEGWPLYRPLSQFRSLLLHPTVTAIVVEGTQSQFAFDGVPCTHAEYVVLEIDRLVDTFFAKTIKHLLGPLHPTPARSAQSSLPTMERSAQILCLGRGLDATEVAFKCGIPESRVKVIADRTVLLEYLAEQFRQTKNPSKAGV